MGRRPTADRNLTRGALRWLQTLSERAQKKNQGEVCGLIVTEDGVNIKLLYVPNEASDSGQWSISGHSYVSAKRRAAIRGMRAIGTFHSHPISEAIPGFRDKQTARSESLMLIYDVCGRQARLWKIQRIKGYPKATELRLNVIGT